MARRTTTASLGAVAALAAALLTAGPAGAAPSAVASQHAATTASAHQRVVDYWTPERMAAAKDGSVLAPAPAERPRGQVEAGAPKIVPAAKPVKPPSGGSGTSTGGYWTSGGRVVATTGKVFFTLSSGNYVCSGSAVTSANESTVLTAGHCVSDAGTFATNWAFVPAYDDNVRPYGTWTARQLHTTTQWRSGEDFDYDIGFATMNTLGGASLTDTVGAQGIGFNLARGQATHAFGFPAASPYDGSELAYCAGTVVQDTYYGSQDQGLACDMTGGSSGGPWMVAFNGSTGTLNSVNSFGYRGVRNIMWGPYFGSVAQSLYTSAQSG
jgi:V8-like Glu-specific endopeptidase